MSTGSEVIAFNRARLDEDEREIGAVPLAHRRVADIAAKRHIIDRCEKAISDQGIYMEDGQEDLALDVLEHMADCWAGHPEHRMQWPR